MKAVRFTKAEVEVLCIAVANYCGLLSTSTADTKAGLRVLEKLEVAAMPVKSSGINARDAVTAFTEVLGARLVLPPGGAAGVWAQMANRLKMLGLTRADCVTVAKVAAVEWAGAIKAESLVRQADALLSNSQQSMAWGGPKRTTKAPAEMDDL